MWCRQVAVEIKLTDGSKEKVVRLRAQRCPICDRPAEVQYRPFCSRRCADLDLGRWFKEDYRFASDDEPDLDQGPSEEF